MKFTALVLSAFLLTSCITNVVKRKGAAGDTEKPIPYDLPATAPIPPVNYCFEKNGTNGAPGTSIELTLAGDSATGKIIYSKLQNNPGYDFKGVIYGTTLIVNYSIKTDTGVITQEEQWKVAKDSLYMIKATQATDSTTAHADLNDQTGYALVLHKVACK